MPKNFGEIVDADLTPDDPEHSRRILDPWLIRTVSVDSAEWKDVRDRELQRHRGKLRRRKVKSFFKLALAPNINFTRWYRGLEPWVRELDGIQRLALGVR